MAAWLYQRKNTTFTNQIFVLMTKIDVRDLDNDFQTDIFEFDYFSS